MSKIIPKLGASMDGQTGRNASRMRRTQLVAGKAGLPPSSSKERVRRNKHNAKNQEVISLTVSETNSAATTKSNGQSGMTGRDASRARRVGLIQGKSGILKSSVTAANLSAASLDTADDCSCDKANEGRLVAQAVRSGSKNKGNKNKGNQGRTRDATTRPSGRLRNVDPIQYPPKVAESKSYAGHKVTGVRIGRGECYRR
jgi:hypothetical protein